VQNCFWVQEELIF